MDKKGWTKDKRSLVSLILGIVFLFIGAYPLFLGNISSIQFLSGPIQNQLFINVCLVLGGLLLFIDSWSISHGGGKLISIIAGLIVLAIGLVPILVFQFNISIQLPFTNLAVFQGVLAFFGVYLLIDAFIMKTVHHETI
jgi:hypothetical protein